MLERTIVLPDIHAPQHHEPSINAVIDYIKYFKPHRLILLGDVCDFNSLSTYDLHSPSEFIYLEDELDSTNDILDRLEKAVGKRCEKVLIGGNHEDRYKAYLSKHLLFGEKVTRSLKRFKDSWADEYSLDERGWKWCEYGGHFKFGKVVYTHGWFSGPNACQQMGKLFPGSNVVFGHSHTHQIYGCMDEKQLPIEVETIGTLSRFDLSYLRGKPPFNWVHGFVSIVTREDGRFSKRFTNIIGGSFIDERREYGGK